MNLSHGKQSQPRRLSRRLALAGAGASAMSLTLNGRGRFVAAQPASDWEAVDRLFAAVTPRVTMLAAELVDGEIRPIHEIDADAVFPVGSTFKFWVLGALALKIAAGELAWEQEVTIEEQYKSIPGGDLTYAPNGSVFTLRYLAERMMQKSDNTATDHILFLVGREFVEQTMAEMGHGDSSLNIPFLSTREFALLKLHFSTEYVDELYALPPDERRARLDAEVSPVDLAVMGDVSDFVSPKEVERVEWFATRHDLAAAVTWLQAKAEEPGLRPLTEVISLETQLEYDGAIWPYSGFKGGYEPGVLSGTWLLHRSDGRRFIYSAGFVNPDEPLDMATAVTAMEAGRDALAKAP